ncbi:hypothetical protein HDU84_008559 [Entophlyctis sp. JEL0112]|nr:hypothetical protein HDU84_008559 [Entophlyctis sp. JEL0112]
MEVQSGSHIYVSRLNRLVGSIEAQQRAAAENRNAMAGLIDRLREISQDYVVILTASNTADKAELNEIHVPTCQKYVTNVKKRKDTFELDRCDSLGNAKLRPFNLLTLRRSIYKIREENYDILNGADYRRGFLFRQKSRAGLWHFARFRSGLQFFWTTDAPDRDLDPSFHRAAGTRQTTATPGIKPVDDRNTTGVSSAKRPWRVSRSNVTYTVRMRLAHV